MNKKVKHGSLDELISLNARCEGRLPESRKWLVGRMEEYDPGGKRAHEIAAKYHQVKE